MHRSCGASQPTRLYNFQAESRLKICCLREADKERGKKSREQRREGINHNMRCIQRSTERQQGRCPHENADALGHQTTEVSLERPTLLQEIPVRHGQTRPTHNLAVKTRGEIRLYAWHGGHRTDTSRGTIGATGSALPRLGRGR